MIEIEHLTYTYPGAAAPALRDVSLEVAAGEFVLVVGESGAGKSTLLRVLNGLVPHFYGGTIAGRVRVAGHDPVAEGPGALSRVVGMVFQDPEAQMVTDTVEDELAFALENAGLPPDRMRKRVAEVLDQLGLEGLRGRRVSSLSGGERQRVAIGAVLTLQPQVLVLDEPTSQLDPQGAEEVLDTLVKLNKDLGLTILLAEHRLERVVQHVDRIIYLPPAADRAPLIDGDPRAVLAQIPLVPPLAAVARLLDWHPLPLTIKEARRFVDPAWVTNASTSDPASPTPSHNPQSTIQTPQSPTPIIADTAWYSYGRHEAVRGVSLRVAAGEIVALMGRNGAGKTTLLKLLMGLLRPTQGRVLIAGQDTRKTPLETLARSVGYVPQRPDVLLFADTVQEEVDFTRRNHGLPGNGATAALLGRLGLGAMAGRDPKEMSVGERQRVALAAVLAAEPAVLLLDEPTRGLDYGQKANLTATLQRLAAEGRAILLATHDVELAARVADRVVLLSAGQIVVDGPAREVMTDSLVFASQVSKLFRDPRLVTVEDVAARVRAGEAG
jgi:energy-coupling factor transport system ATP-binding protein